MRNILIILVVLFAPSVFSEDLSGSITSVLHQHAGQKVEIHLHGGTSVEGEVFPQRNQVFKIKLSNAHHLKYPSSRNYDYVYIDSSSVSSVLVKSNKN